MPPGYRPLRLGSLIAHLLQGENIEFQHIDRQNTNATAMGWQPTGKLLAVGWEDGACALGLAARRLLD